MALALVLVVLVIVELALSVWASTLVRAQRRELATMRECVANLGEVVRTLSRQDVAEVKPDVLPVDASLLATATEADVEKAKAVLRAMGIEDV